MSTVAERVERGAALLDVRDPGWWRADVDRAIDLDRLDLGDGDVCVLGQRCPLEAVAAYQARPESDYDDGDEHGRYSAYSELLFSGRWDDRVRRVSLLEATHGHGFAWMSGDRAEFDELTAAWRDLITRRRELAAVSA